MFYDIMKAIESCEEEPSLIFEAIKMNYREVYEEVLQKEDFDFNICDIDGNNVLMRLLKNKDYDLVSYYIDNKNIDINHQNNDGDTFAHILLSMKGLQIIDIYKVLKKNKKFTPNIMNNKGETILDESIKNGYTYVTAKVLEDDRFNEIGVHSFKKYYDTYIKARNYGGYSKLNNLELLIDSLECKEVSPKIKKIINYLKENYDVIKEEVINNKTKNMDKYINDVLFA